MNETQFKNYCIKYLDIKVNQLQEEQLNKYYELLVEWNKKFNLTTIIEKKDVYLKHFYDSLCITKAINLKEYKKLCDFGTGAGFPGIVIAIFYKNLKITLLESNKKKCEFLSEISKTLELDNIIIINERAEIYSKNNIETFDLVTCRAVSHLNIIIEIAIPLLKVKGFFIPLKADLAIEILETKNKINLLNAKITQIIEYELPIESSKRAIPIIQKLSETNKKYPREYNKIIKDLKKVK